MKRKTKRSQLNSSKAPKLERVFTRNDFEVRPVTKEDKWCHFEVGPNKEAPYGYIVAIPNYSKKMSLSLGGIIVRTRLFKKVWYLQVVETAGEENYSQYSSEVTISKEELKNKMLEKYQDFTIDYNDSACIGILEYTESGRVKTIKIGNKNLSGVEVRTIFGLKSANFEVSIEGENIKFVVKGYGHGIGMSQTGADSLASSGSTYEDIIHHFYIGVEIKDM